MYTWCRDWLVNGQSLYTSVGGSTDYPPNAIVLLAPFAWLPWPAVVAVWTLLNVALLALVPWLLVHAVSLHRSIRPIVPVLLFCCWNSSRTLLQFTLFSMALAFVAIW